MSLHNRNAYGQGVSAIVERRKGTTGFYRWAIYIFNKILWRYSSLFFLAKVIKNIYEKTMLSIRLHLAIRLDLSVMICLSGKRSSRWDIRHTDGISGLVFLGIPPVFIL